MTKRADRRTDGYLPEYERGGGERYAVRGPDPGWTEAQDGVLVAAVCACRGRAAFKGMAPTLMPALGHPPGYAPGCLPHPNTHARTCIRALELRLVSKILAAYEGWRPGRLAGFHRHTREEFPLTWGVKVKILRPYHRKVVTGRPRLDMTDLLRLLGRSTAKDVLAYFDRLEKEDFEDESDETAEPPVKPAWSEQLADYVKSIDYCLEVDSPAWRYKDAINRLLKV